MATASTATLSSTTTTTTTTTPTTTTPTTATPTTASTSSVLLAETTKEHINGTRLQLFRELSEETCLERFHNNNTKSFSRDPHELYLELKVKKRKIGKLKLHQDQYDLLIPPSGHTVDSTKFDITLLMVLLTNFCGFKYPMKNWIPQPKDIDIFANIVRIKRSRDEVQHKPFAVSDAEFNRIVPLFKQPLLALDVPKEKIKNILTMRIIDEETKITLQKCEQSKDMMQKYEQSQTSFNHNFIPPVANFFSRDEELDQLHDKMIKDFRLKLGTVLSGFPGVGKSETARQYWMKYGQSLYEDIIVWVNAAENKATMESEFQNIGDECGIPKIKKPDGNYVETKKLVDLVYRHFAAKVTASTRKVLFVFDGADDQNVLYQFLPKSIDYAPYILITSQCTSWDQRFNHLELQVFNSKDALQFFTENISKTQYANKEQIEELLSELSYHPLALQQALSYIHKNSTTVDRYMSLLNQHKMKMLSEGAKQVGDPSVNSTMTISINRLRGLDKDAIILLGVLAHLDGKEIKKGFLLMFFDNDEFKLNTILSVLRKYSIVNFDTSINDGVEFEDQVIRIHSLTQCFLESKKKKIRSKNLKKVAHVFIEDLKACKKAAKPQDGKLWLNHFYKICENDFKKSKILNSFVNSGQELLRDLLLTRGNYSMLSELFEYICEQQKQIHGEKNLVYLSTRTFLAECFDQIGLKQKALNTIEDTIKSQLEIIGPLDLYYLKSRSVLANCLANGTNDEVERALQIYIKIKKALTVTNDDDLYIRTSHHIAYCFVRKGEHGKAIQILKEVEEVQLKTLGSTNSEYLKTKRNLALFYSDAKNFNLAIQLLKEIVEVQFKTFGSTNSEYLKAKRELALCYFHAKKFDSAFQLLKEVEEVQLKTLEPNNFEYLKTKHYLALCYRDTKEFDLAIQLFIEVEKVQLETLGPTSSEYLETKQNLALCYSKVKKFDLAIQLFIEVEKVQLETLGPTSSEYLETKQNLALCYSKVKKFDLAIQLLKEVEEVQLKTFGPTNSEYLETKQNLAFVTVMQCRSRSLRQRNRTRGRRR